MARSDPRRRTSFDVICAGEPLWKTKNRPGHGAPTLSAGILNVARRVARSGLRVGLATVVDDDRRGRALLAEMAALGVDVGGVTLAPRAADLVVVDAAGGQAVVAERDAARDFEIPARWSSQVLLLSGLSPVTSKAAALCKAARKARRDGTVVVLDAAGSLRQWAGRDPRTMSMVIREAHVLRCSIMDLAVLGTDSASVRQALRPDATLVVSDGVETTVTGPFGEVRVKGGSRAPDDADEECTAAVCDELARPHQRAESHAARWHRVLASAGTAST